ncbi:MAG: histidine phosphatase family protein [Naasia sp.]
MSARAIHLVRHGEVHNPTGVLYGRIEGFGLSELGHRMATTAAGSLAGRPITRLLASPLQRARESAAPWAAEFGLAIETEERVIEPWNRFEGTRMLRGAAVLQRPESWPWLRNPYKPSWGEPYADIAARMIAAMRDADEQAGQDDEIVFVSHQLPIWMVHRSIAGLKLHHDPRRRRCALSSITTVRRDGYGFVELSYSDPAAGLGTAAVDEGAV